jgi:hypothetical protein
MEEDWKNDKTVIIVGDCIKSLYIKWKTWMIWSTLFWSVRWYLKSRWRFCAEEWKPSYSRNRTCSQYKRQLRSAEMCTVNFGICCSFFKKEGRSPRKDTSFWEISLTEDTTLLKPYCYYFYTNLNTPTWLFFLGATTNLVTLPSFMASTIKSQKNMAITTYGTTSTIPLTIYPLLPSLRDKSFAYMADSPLNAPPLTPSGH